ncbi:MAG: alpha/beta fold hydrolase [Actinophytocola sp.]|uniref:alpha/beta fold hydrolase n=1 Tax=Actinophytocola sp. TaxID=1872138 RepID=UPI0013260415|nr:alpha/beta hydrolase [Actinophytocola sp.]MPZ84729.1 alpha/beta fold hydrolase [Actinophytocola sp.]
MTGLGWVRRFAVLFATAGLVAGCTAGPSARPGIVVQEAPDASSAAPTATPEVPPLEEMTGGMAWRECSEEVRGRLAEQKLPGWLPIECGKINAVLDSPYAPGRGVARVQLLRAGKGPVPLVVVNDVDGLPGTLYAARLAATLPQEFFEKFSLIGMDRRGTGNSAAANCVPEEVRRTIVDADPADLPIDVWLEAAQTAGQRCSIALESQLPALDTWRTAADLDTLRDAMGVTRLNGIGHGEGSRVLSVFADRFPDKVGRLVLDGVPDPTQDAAVALEGIAKGAEAAYDAFSTDCVNRHCELGSQPKRALLELLGTLRDSPMTEPDALDITAGSAMHAVMIGLSDRSTWPALSAALAKAGDGDPSGLVSLLVPVVIGTDVQAATLDSTLVISCNDTKTRLSPGRIEEYGKDWKKRFPTFGALAAQRLALCSPWTVPNQPLPTPTARDAPPVMVIGTASDAVTPEEGSKRAAQQLASGVYVSWQGGGHGALGFSPCATAAAVSFLTDAKVPRNGTVCPP